MSKSVAPMTDRIMKRVRAKGRGWVFTPRHFVDFGTRGAVDMALSRLAKAGAIRRVGRGLYDYPRQHDKLGDLSPDPDSLAAALAIQSGDSLAPSGPAAANSLGISTQVPAKVSYATSGHSRTKRAGGRSLTLRHSRAPVLDDAPDSANAVVQALAYLGKDQIDSAVITRFAQRVDDRGMKALLRARPQMSSWMGDVVLKIDAARHG
jgi:hypothetical protein